MAQDTNQNRPADVAQADSVGGMAKRLLNPAHLSDLARHSCSAPCSFRVAALRRARSDKWAGFHHDSWQHRADLPLRRELKAQRAEYADGKPGPVVSVVVPLYNTPEKFFGQMLASAKPAVVLAAMPPFSTFLYRMRGSFAAALLAWVLNAAWAASEASTSTSCQWG